METVNDNFCQILQKNVGKSIDKILEIIFKPLVKIIVLMMNMRNKKKKI